jgi:chromosome segregation ATPase
MSLNAVIDYYKQVKRSEAAAAQLRDDVITNTKQTVILAKEIDRKKNELAQLQQKAQSLTDELRVEEERFKKIKAASGHEIE